MNWKKVINQLKENNLIDDRGLVCHSNANVTYSTNYVLFLKFEHVNQYNLPRFMLLSIINDKLIISKATLGGKYKEYYATIDLKNLFYEKEYKKDFIYTYEFKYKVGDNSYEPFYINPNFNNERVKELVNSIKNFKL